MMEKLKKIFSFFSERTFFHPPMDAPDLAGDSHRGLTRRHNEDSYIYIKGSRKTPSIAIVADGIGGHHNGDIASGILIRLFLERWREYVRDGNKYHLKELITFLERLFLYINDSIARINKRFGSSHPMGTTLTAAAFFRNYLISHHAGDSRIYRVRKGSIRQLTRDHSVAVPEDLRKKLEEQYQKEAFADPADRRKSFSLPRHMITKAVGTKRKSLPEYNLFKVKKEDRYILCSDGLHLHLSPEDICRIVMDSPNAAKAVNSLVNTALQRGGKDNVTIICAFFN